MFRDGVWVRDLDQFPHLRRPRAHGALQEPRESPDSPGTPRRPGTTSAPPKDCRGSAPQPQPPAKAESRHNFTAVIRIPHFLNEKLNETYA
jgi:hypothetical protein